MQEKKQGIHYFKGWNSYSIPFNPENPIDSAAIDFNYSYYIGIYENDVLMSFKKMNNGLIVWEDNYEYWENSDILKKRKMIKEDSSIITQNFDEKGKILKD